MAEINVILNDVNRQNKARGVLSERLSVTGVASLTFCGDLFMSREMSSRMKRVVSLASLDIYDALHTTKRSRNHQLEFQSLLLRRWHM